MCRVAIGRVCLKLTVLMGVTWILDVLSWALNFEGPYFIWWENLKSFSSLLFDRCRVTHFRPSLTVTDVVQYFGLFLFMQVREWRHQLMVSGIRTKTRIVCKISLLCILFTLHFFSFLHLLNFQRARRAQPRSFHFHCCRMSTSSECEIVVNFFLDGIFA